MPVFDIGNQWGGSAPEIKGWGRWTESMTEIGG